MSFKKFDGSTWQPITPKKLKGIPYTGTLPAVLTNTKAGYLHRYRIYGNTEQTGTPTPENPIVPQECGEKTENLFDEEYPHIRDALQYRALNLGNGTYTLSSTVEISQGSAGTLFFLTGNVSSGASSATNAVYKDRPITVTSTDGYVTIAYRTYTTDTPVGKETMLNRGSTALPYEPYGYKLPLTSAGQNVDIYLGESQTTRRIKKLVLTGEEKISGVVESTLESGAYCFSCLYIDLGMTDILDYDLDMRNISYPRYVSDHFQMRATPTQQVVEYSELYAGEIGANSRLTSRTFNRYIIFCISGISTIADFKAYLRQQYANGTPVTIWYILAEPEAAVVNEPLMKIGDYADTIDSTQTNVQIPISANSTTISWAGEGLAPSEFDSVQEWVDIPTYKYTNGAWVEDN